jgi:hypothetical protein
LYEQNQKKEDESKEPPQIIAVSVPIKETVDTA